MAAIRPDDDDLVRWRFVVTSPEKVRVPVVLAIGLRGGNPSTHAGKEKPVTSPDVARWSITVPATALSSRVEVAFPRGMYMVSAQADGFIETRISIDVKDRDGERALPGQVLLSPMPRIEGRVVSDQGVPVAASVESEDGIVLGRTEPDGTFLIRLQPDRWPHRLLVTAPGFGSVVVSLPPAATQTRTGDIALVKGGRILILSTEEQRNVIESVEVMTLRGSRTRSPYRTISRESLEQNDFTIGKVAAGRYLVILRGSEPLERFAQIVEVSAGEDAMVRAEWTAQNVELRTFRGDEPLPNATLDLHSIESMWKTSVKTRSDGRRTLNVWQPGELGFVLDAADISGYFGSVDFSGEVVEIRVPNREVHGRIVDADTNLPLANVNVALTGNHGGRRVISESDGSFRFVGVRAGTYALLAGATGMSSASRRVTVSEGIASQEIVIALRREAEYELEVLTWNGMPADDAIVVEVAGSRVTGIRHTDATGKVRLPRRSATQAVIILARDGTFHATEVRSPADSSPLRTVIPPPSSSINVLVQSQPDHKPIEGVGLVMRLNGILFPADVMETLYERTGAFLRSRSDGLIRLARAPAGTYEFWPIRSASDREQVQTGQMGAAPVVMVAGPGENNATLSFVAAHQPASP
jgi:hypothetical protein